MTSAESLCLRDARCEKAAVDSAFGQSEHPLADDIVLNLVGPGRDRAAPRREHPIGPFAAIHRAEGIVLELAVGPEQLHRKLLDAQVEVAGAKLHYRALGTRLQTLELTCELPI